MNRTDSSGYAPYQTQFLLQHNYRFCKPEETYETGEIAYMDQVLGVFFARMEQSGFLQNALIVAIGDHGESLGEHRESDHGYYVYDATIKIPLIFSWRGHFNSRIVNDQVQEIDVLPTIADLLRIKTGGSIKEGQCVIS